MKDVYSWPLPPSAGPEPRGPKRLGLDLPSSLPQPSSSPGQDPECGAGVLSFAVWGRVRICLVNGLKTLPPVFCCLCCTTCTQQPPFIHPHVDSSRKGSCGDLPQLAEPIDPTHSLSLGPLCHMITFLLGRKQPKLAATQEDPVVRRASLSHGTWEERVDTSSPAPSLKPVSGGLEMQEVLRVGCQAAAGFV